ncbi:GNAT family N-acetyltransferase [Pseudogemmobacter faecipullorum]|uniref:L-ornithine N(alpha)-acyltransferase n=1 Tax=Pseudogemmobacter faecipullorum TaxID=2755041 RepID=A0ABS8CGR9_9RHOB|nr:GNAT family N-acyltransferase [Pseudogemmobacter faecipullorum]MCB5408388.1 GNAT family N-acetyltransferase [Pseudogemmobacter faecipullorum]
MPAEDTIYSLRLATDPQDLLGAQRLRYLVFVEELGASGPMVDHSRRLERDAFDPLFDHLILVDNRIDPASGDHVAGAYRLLPCDRLGPEGRFYSEAEFDLAPLRATGRKLLELGRTCVHPEHRGGPAMLLLWNGLADYVLERGIEIMFGPASFHGTDPAALALPLSWLWHHHLAPSEIRVRALGAPRAEMDLIPPGQMARAEAMAAMPALIKAYLRLGGFVGDGAWIDRAFNTTDVCLVMDTGRMSARHRNFYTRKQGQS